jgi:hypothetical protein
MKCEETLIWNCTSLDKESILLEFLLRMAVGFLADKKDRKFLQTHVVFISEMNVVASGFKVRDYKAVQPTSG